MKISRDGIDKLIEWEGCVLHVYNDAAGLPTIGCGHLLHHNESYPTGITHSQAIDLLSNDLMRFEDVVNKEVKVPLTQSQYDALVIFAFNIGTGAFRNSTLLKELNQGKYDEVPEQLSRWTKAGGKKIAGLVNRRNNEIALWNA